jgi:molecular chaperone Hsp33
MNSAAKRAYIERDRVVKAITADGRFRLAAIKNTKAVQTAQHNHQLGYLATLLLGRAMSATSLLASFLNGEERVIIELMGNGPAERVYAESLELGEVRGFVGNPQCALDFTNPATRLEDALGVGIMRVSRILYGNYEPVVGMVELAAGDISTDLAYYLHQSEQIPSAVMLDVQFDDDGSVLQSGGLLVQAMPGAREDAIEAMVNNLRNLEQLPELYSDKFTPEEILKLVAQQDLAELANTRIDFFCRCSLDRFKASLATLGTQEIRSMRSENQRELVCHYCGTRYHLSDADFEELITGLQAKEN